MKKFLALFGLLFLLAQPAFSQCGVCPQACAREVKAPICPPVVCAPCNPCAPQQIVVDPCNPCFPQFRGAAAPLCRTCPQQRVAAPVYFTAVAADPCNPCCPPKRYTFVCPNAQCIGAAAPICCPQKRSGWTVFKEDYLGFD